MSHLIFNMLEDRGDEAILEDIPLIQYSHDTLDLVLNYCESVNYESEFIKK